MSEIRCHNGYCGGNPAHGPADCPLCGGRGWHFCGGVLDDAERMAGTPYDSWNFAEVRRTAALAKLDKSDTK